MSQQRKIILFVFTLLFLFMNNSAITFAQNDKETDNATTAGGGAQDAGGGGQGNVVEWGQKIADKLQKGANNLYSKMNADICNGSLCATKKVEAGINKYWCTWLIIDSYKLAGINIPQDLVATSLYRKMKPMGHAGPSGAEELKKVKPGWAIGFGNSENDGPGGHIGLVKSIDVDDRGNGKLVTLESNSSAPSHTWPIVNGKIGGKHKNILGFAGGGSGAGIASGGGGPVQTVSCVITKVGNPKEPPPPLPPECNVTSGGTANGSAIASGSATASGYVPPSDNNCGGKYTKDMAKNPTKKNYGDPTCNYSKDKLLALIKQKDAKFADLWFYTIVKGESGYNPNALAMGGIQDSIDSGGAWGLLQLGSSKPPGGPPDKAGKNGVLDRGDVNWEMQVEKAISYNKEKLNCSFKYWATAKSVWGKHSC